MTFKELNVPLTWLIGGILFAVSSTLTIEFRYAKADAVEKLSYTVQVSSKENQLLMLQTRMFQAKSEDEKVFIKAQIDRLLREIAALNTNE